MASTGKQDSPKGPKFTGSRVLITGGPSGVGFSIAKAFADHGAGVILADVNQAQLDEAVKTIGPGAIGYTCDVASCLPQAGIDPELTISNPSSSADCGTLARYNYLAEEFDEKNPKKIGVILTRPVDMASAVRLLVERGLCALAPGALQVNETTMTSAPPGQRRLAAKSPQAEPPLSTAEDRRENKRASDRLAQREHRRRQSEYIDELEAQLKLIKEGSQSESVATLVAENERLKSEVPTSSNNCKSLHSSINLAMSQLKMIAESSHPVSPAPSFPDVISIELPKVGAATYPANDDSLEKPGPGDGVSQQYRDAHTRGNGPKMMLSFEDSRETVEAAPFVDPLIQLSQSDVIENAHDTSQTSTRQLPPAPVDNINPSDIYSPLLSRSAWERLGQLDHTILPDIGYTKPPLPSDNCDSALLHAHGFLQTHDPTTPDLDNIHPESPSAQAPHKNIPNIPFPTLRDDELLYAMVDSARWQAVINDTKIPKPELIDCVLDSTANQFSLELKHYLEPMRRLRRNEEYFASYWLVATLIRPPQKSINQSGARPLLRNQLILDFHIHKVPIHPIMADLGEFLETKLSCVAGGLALGEEQLVQSLKDLRNWSLKPGFFDRHPQFRDAYRQYAV
ncbi:uncharacterized protein KD926_008527 [Aspergillus affinis]|uniref:uncharacterized protein n=1 Tax=Aspergillus affinis TaxID=1070780 RepID=UPI0022FF00F1|nr:uncharacterized protein KD926_008527 [Aspergillus affinis]KAI9040203.1 hypothetical protein KD926_008527 [Aspergillus affinis]